MLSSIKVNSTIPSEAKKAKYRGLDYPDESKEEKSSIPKEQIVEWKSRIAKIDQDKKDEKKLLLEALQKKFDAEKKAWTFGTPNGRQMDDRKKVTHICLSENKDYLFAYVRPKYGSFSKERVKTFVPIGYLVLCKIEYSPFLSVHECESSMINLDGNQIFYNFAFIGQQFAIITSNRKYEIELTFYDYKAGKLTFIVCENFNKNRDYFPSKIWPLPNGYFYLNRISQFDNNQFLRLCKFDNNKLRIISEISDGMTKRPPPLVDTAGRLYYVATKDVFDGHYPVDCKFSFVDVFSNTFESQTLFEFSICGGLRDDDRAGLFRANYNLLPESNATNLSLIRYELNLNSGIYMLAQNYNYWIFLPPLYVSESTITWYQEQLPVLPPPLVRIVMDYRPPRDWHEPAPCLFRSSLPQGLPEIQFQKIENWMRKQKNSFKLQVENFIKKQEQALKNTNTENAIRKTLLNIFNLLRDAIEMNSNPSFVRILLDAEQQINNLGLQIDLIPAYQKRFKFFGSLEQKPITIENQTLTKDLVKDIQLLHSILRNLIKIEATRFNVDVKELRIQAQEQRARFGKIKLKC